MSKISFALIGCGKIGERHAVQMNRVGRLAAVCDIDQAKAEIFGKKYNCNAYININDIIDYENEIDVIAICTPNGLHAVQSVLALNNGFHVLCEKPMALTTSDCQLMIEAAEKNARQLIIVKQNSFNPPVVAVKQLIDQGKLGKILSLQVNCFWNRNAEYYKTGWRGTIDMDGGTLFTQFSHFIDMMYWFAGNVEEVQSFKANLLHQGIIDFEDTGVVNFTFASGALGSLHYSVNSFQKNMEGSILLIAEKGTVKIGGEYLNKLEYQQIENIHLEIKDSENLSNDYGSYLGSMSNHDKVYDNLIEVLNHNGFISANGKDGLKTVEIIQRIIKS